MTFDVETLSTNSATPARNHNPGAMRLPNTFPVIFGEGASQMLPKLDLNKKVLETFGRRLPRAVEKDPGDIIQDEHPRNRLLAFIRRQFASAS